MVMTTWLIGSWIHAYIPFWIHVNAMHNQIHMTMLKVIGLWALKYPNYIAKDFYDPWVLCQMCKRWYLK